MRIPVSGRSFPACTSSRACVDFILWAGLTLIERLEKEDRKTLRVHSSLVPLNIAARCRSRSVLILVAALKHEVAALGVRCMPAQVCIQFPDPWREDNAARRVLTPQLANHLADALPSGVGEARSAHLLARIVLLSMLLMLVASVVLAPRRFFFFFVQPRCCTIQLVMVVTVFSSMRIPLLRGCGRSRGGRDPSNDEPCRCSSFRMCGG